MAEKRTVLVTGGTRGLGKAIATAFASKGYRVAVNHIGHGDNAAKLEQETGIKTFKWDVSNFQECLQGIAEVENHFGSNIEIVVNNAGITKDSMMHKMPLENWLAVINTNLGSVFNVSRCVIEKMRAAKFGRIISLSSVNAHGMLGQTNYSASKAGIEGFTKALALENARSGVTCNAIAPGYINTEMVAAVPAEALAKIIERVPMSRLGEPSEIARAALFLADDEASFITGVILPVNGGLRVY